MSNETIIDKLLFTKQGNLLISIILGFGIAMLFKPICDDCIIYISPDLRKENKKKYNINNNCYENNVIPIKCKGNELNYK